MCVLTGRKQIEKSQKQNGTRFSLMKTTALTRAPIHTHTRPEHNTDKGNLFSVVTTVLNLLGKVHRTLQKW